jgi:hypothetical protein
LVAWGVDLETQTVDNTDLIPGQNYNVAFNINITAPRGSEGWVACVLYSNYNTILAETPYIPVYVR